jgi:uncharacterized protein DUF3891
MFRSQRRAVVFPQLNHATLAGELALLWGNAEFERPCLPFVSFVRGVALHDRGYGELDNDPIGGVPRERWLEIQRRGFGEHDEDPVVDLVASLHIHRLVAGREPAMTDALPRLFERAGVERRTGEAADAITHLCDRISFDVCFEEPADGSVSIDERDVSYRYDGGDCVVVEPWPFAPPRFALLLVGYGAHTYPDRLARVVQPISFAPG